MINKINSNISFSRGKCPITVPMLKKIIDKQDTPTAYFKIGDELAEIYPSSYKKDLFDKLSKEAELDENIKQAKLWQEIADQKKLEESYLDLKI